MPQSLSFAAAGGVTLAAETWGEAANPSVVLLHGGGQTRHSWQGTARLLAQRGWYVLAVDQRGHGQSDWAFDGHYSFDDYVQDFKGVVATLASPPVLASTEMRKTAAGAIRRRPVACAVRCRAAAQTASNEPERMRINHAMTAPVASLVACRVLIRRPEAQDGAFIPA